MSKKIIFIVLLATFVIEHVGQMNQFTWKPSKFLRFCDDLSIDFFTAFGKLLAQISSFLTLIEFRDLLKTLNDLVVPLVNLFVSPLYIVQGYVEQAWTYANKVGLIYVGTGILLALICLVCYRYSSLIKEKIKPITDKIRSRFNPNRSN